MSEKPRLAAPRLRIDWDEGRTERLLSGVHGRIARQKRIVRAASLSATAAAMVCIAIFAFRWNRTAPAIVATSNAASELASAHAMRLADGSDIQVDRTSSDVRIIEDSASRVRVRLVRGASRYNVVPNAARTFEVESGQVTVTVVGTEFIVEQRGEKTWVDVLRGKVRVAWGSEHVLLAAGENGTFPRDAQPNGADDALAMAGENDAPAGRGSHATQSYRARVARRDYRGAYAVLSRNPGLAGDTVEELLVAADVARLSDHPSEAVPYLQRILREHPRDERAPMAAFTLGRTLGGLGRTEEAMNMFGRVHSAWPKSPLAEDALLRQAEAASQLGDMGTARRIAEQYDRDYPSGRRRADVRRFARLP